MKEAEEEEHRSRSIQDHYPNQTALAQEALLILAGHPSGLLSNSIQNELQQQQQQQQSIDHFFHSNSSKPLIRFTHIAQLYRHIINFGDRATRFDGHSSSKEAGDQEPESQSIDFKSPAISSFGSSLLKQLQSYETLLVDLETRLVSLDPKLVSPIEIENQNRGWSTPLSALLAEIHHWEPILQALNQLINQIKNNHPQSKYQKQNKSIRWSSTELIELIYQHSLTGSPHLSKILIDIQLSIETVWMNSFRSFVIYGQSPNSSRSELVDDLFYSTHSSSDDDDDDDDEQNQQNNQDRPIQFSFKSNALPNLPNLIPNSPLLITIQEICRSLSMLKTLNPINQIQSINLIRTCSSSEQKNKNIQISFKLQNELRNVLSNITGPSDPNFRSALENVQEVLSNYLFSTFLNTEMLMNTFESLIDIFLLRQINLNENLIEGLIKLKTNRLEIRKKKKTKNRYQDYSTSSSQFIKLTLNKRELDVLLLKAILSSEFEEVGNYDNNNNNRKKNMKKMMNLEGFQLRLIKKRNKKKKKQEEEEIKEEEEEEEEEEREEDFSEYIINSRYPILLNYKAPYGLRIIITKQIIREYSKINSMILTNKIYEERMKMIWIKIIRRERERNKWKQLKVYKLIEEEGEGMRRKKKEKEKMIEIKKLVYKRKYEMFRIFFRFLIGLGDCINEDVIKICLQNFYKECNNNHNNNLRDDKQQQENEDDEEEEEEEEEEGFQCKKKIEKNHLRMITNMMIGLNLIDTKMIRDLKRIFKMIEKFIMIIEEEEEEDDDDENLLRNVLCFKKNDDETIKIDDQTGEREEDEEKEDDDENEYERKLNRLIEINFKFNELIEMLMNGLKEDPNEIRDWVFNNDNDCKKINHHKVCDLDLQLGWICRRNFLDRLIFKLEG